MAWIDDDNAPHSLILYDALYYPNSLANVISITKLGPDNDDSLLNMQTFTTRSIFSWNDNSMIIKHSSVNLPELSLVTKHDPIALLTRNKCNANKEVSLSKEESFSLFDSVSKSDLDALLNSTTLTPLQLECQYFHHRLKCLPDKHMKHLINVGALPKRLHSVRPPPCLACLLGKSKKRP